jgi:dethiobiotin synthetase
MANPMGSGHCSGSPLRALGGYAYPAAMHSGVFITGTDTGIGKSIVAASLLRALQAQGLRALAMKPVASGCAMTPQGLRNEDAELLRTHSSGAPDYALVNPYALSEPIAPHLAAAKAGVEIRLDAIVAAFIALSTMSQCMVVEGVGGWAVPLSDTLMQADLVRKLELPVILVVGLRLGCINHALLSARAIEADGCKLIGWIANTIDPAMACVDENLAALRARMPAPYLGVLPHARAPDPRALAPHLRGAVAAII